MISVFEAEAAGVRETLSWIKDMQMQEDAVTVESDSQLTILALQSIGLNLLEVGEVIASCKQILDNLQRILVVFIRKNANKVAHEITRIIPITCSRLLLRVCWRLFPISFCFE
ncbi:hypothetical protein POM88_033747 [Heracleum sosnowskyi]|uniref:RNase H type-1 domain-containing protein n=1 Tax=Heracleum sosnowskyi TaxID=360622 RepID=A0AAD8HHZ3_9APIA|nr:hypothetical protein POM88_033747 [Heracleum sosnowskyi]